MLQRLVLFVGAVAIVVGSFFGTLFVIDMFGGPKTTDQVRADHAARIKAGLEAYRRTRGQYPAPFPDNPLTDLRKELVGGKFLAALPQDPFYELGPNQYRYVSGDGKIYGLLFHMKKPVKPHGDSSCVTGVGSAGSGWWQNAPQCPF
jgi:hypothetical protein